MTSTKELILSTPAETVLDQCELPPDDIHADTYSHEGYIHLIGTGERGPVGKVRTDVQVNFAEPGAWVMQDAWYDFIERYSPAAEGTVVNQVFDALNKGVYKGTARFRFKGKWHKQDWELEPEEGREERRAETRRTVDELMRQYRLGEAATLSIKEVKAAVQAMRYVLMNLSYYENTDKRLTEVSRHVRETIATADQVLGMNPDQLERNLAEVVRGLVRTYTYVNKVASQMRLNLAAMANLYPYAQKWATI